MLYYQYSAKKLAKSGLQYQYNASFSICTSTGRQNVFIIKPLGIKPSSFSIQGRLSKFFGFWLLKYWKILITYKQRRSYFSRQKRKPRYEKKNSVALEMAFLVAENENRQLEDLLQADFGPVPSVSKDYSQKLRILYIENWAHCLFL